MFDYVKGILVNKTFPYCTVECNNVGYMALVNMRTFSNIGEVDDNITLYLKLIHKEDNMMLCGFKTRQERIIFDILTSVSGIGTKVAFALLDEFEINDLINAVIEQDHKLISRTKGVGDKMAQKIVLELKDKLTKLETTSDIMVSKADNSIVSAQTITQVQTVLQSLGYTPKEYKGAIENAIKTINKDDEEELLKEALKTLSVF